VAQAQSVPLGKTARPSLTGILPRKRLFALLDRGSEGPVAWVAGPPGCGKTTLVASYLDHVALPSLWYQLDEGDGDVATFFYYLRLAAEEFREGGEEPLTLLTPEYRAGLALFARRYFQSLYARMRPRFAVVFDGYHEVPASSQLHEVMRVAFSEMPPGGRAIVVSRGDPPAIHARLRANRQLSMVGWDDLRLSREETQSIAVERRPDLPAAILEQLYERTQGWAAGLVLMLAQARVTGAIGDPPDVSAKELVFDYLAGEIFQKLEPEMREFLLKTAYLPQMTATVASTLTHSPRTAEWLGELHKNNYFVSLRQAQPEPVFQYHPMMREFLLARAQEAHAKDLRRKLQKDAAALMQSAGHVEDAFTLYRESHDWDEMARIISTHAEEMLAHGRGETLRHWIEDLPPEMLSRYPWAVYWSASSQAQLAPREARLLFERAFDLFSVPDTFDANGRILACSGAMDAILYELDDFSLLDRWIGVLDQAVAQGTRLPTPDGEARVACSMVFSLTLRQPQRRDIEQWIERALGAAREASDPNLQMFVALLCALTLIWTGLYSKAGTLIESARRLSRARGVTPFSLITLKNVESMHDMLLARADSCATAVREGLEIARATGVHTWTFQLLVYGYGSALGAGNLKEASGLRGALKEHTAGAGRLNLCMLHYFQAWEAMLARDVMRALQDARIALRLAVEVGCPFFEVLCRSALAQVLYELGDRRKCIAQLQRLRAIVRGIHNRHLEYACLLGFADLALRDGRERPGIKALRLGLQIGREFGYQHFLWWWPPALARICAKALEREIEPEYVRSLIRNRGLAGERPPLAMESWPSLFRAHTLGGFRLLKNDAPLLLSADRVPGKAQRRPIELLQVVISLGGEQVSESRITDALWPRVEGDSAHRSFTSALHRLRKLIGEDRAVVLHEGKVSLDRRYFWVDLWAFDEIATAIERNSDPALAERLLDVYRGPFLAGEVDAAWHLAQRERLRNRLARIVGRVMRHWQNMGQTDRAREYYERCVEVDPAAAETTSSQSASNP